MASAFSNDGLDRLEAALAAHIEAGDMPGLVALVARDDEVVTTALGTIAFDDPSPMGTDTLVRIASLTKPITAAAAMLLVEAGLISVHEPVDRLLPELAERHVLRKTDAELDDTLPAQRPITVEDVLTFRLGFGAVMLPPGSTPLQRAEERLQLMTLGPPWPPPPFGADEWIARLGTLPLIAQPGERWLYNTGAQVLGVLIQRASQVPLEQFFATRLFEPLGMHSTAFSWPAGTTGRVATAYAPDENGNPVLFDGPDGFWASPPSFPNASGWLVSTMDDFWAFVQLLRNGGVYDDRRLLSEGSVLLMTSDHLERGPAPRRAAVLGRERVGVLHGCSTGRPGQRAHTWLWVGRWRGHGLAHRPSHRSHRDPLHPATTDLTRPPAGLRRLLGRRSGRDDLKRKARCPSWGTAPLPLRGSPHPNTDLQLAESQPTRAQRASLFR